MEMFFYPEKRIPKPNGKVRVIDPPTRTAKLFLRRLHRLLQSNVHLFHISAHGGIKRRSTFTCSRRHLGKDFLGKVDVTDCFPSISPKMLLSQFRQLGFHWKTSILLCKLMTIRNRVPQGSPLSSDAINLFFYSLDRQMFSLCRAHGSGVLAPMLLAVCSWSHRNKTSVSKSTILTNWQAKQTFLIFEIVSEICRGVTIFDFKCNSKSW